MLDPSQSSTILSTGQAEKLIEHTFKNGTGSCARAVKVNMYPVIEDPCNEAM